MHALLQASVRQVEKAHFHAEACKLELAKAERALAAHELAAKASPREDAVPQRPEGLGVLDCMLDENGYLSPLRREPRVTPQETAHGDLLHAVTGGNRRLAELLQGVAAAADASQRLAQGYAERLGECSLGRLVGWLDELREARPAASEAYWEVLIQANLEAAQEEPPPWSPKEGVERFEGERSKGNLLSHDFRWGVPRGSGGAG